MKQNGNISEIRLSGWTYFRLDSFSKCCSSLTNKYYGNKSVFYDTLMSKNNQVVCDLFAIVFTVWFSFRKKENKANKIFKLNYWWLNYSPKQRIKTVKANLPSLPIMFKLYPDIILQEKEQKMSSQSNSGTHNSTQMHQIMILIF